VLRDDEFSFNIDDIQMKKREGDKSQSNIIAVTFSTAAKSSKKLTYLAYATDDCSVTIMWTKDWKIIFVSCHDISFLKYR